MTDSQEKRPLGAAGWIATLAGSGRMGQAPGTIGSAEACIIAYFLPAQVMPWAILAAILVGTWASGAHARALGQSDPGEVIVDELAGQWIALAGHMVSRASAGWLIPCLALFRLFDILKPWPVNKLEKLPGGVGIMADDLLAGVEANLCLVAFRYFFQGQSGTGLLTWFL
ncbi:MULTISPECIES: phosphatidylglycerophosphatase A family protein [Jonquetella]|uniref:Phosphatidylglycerophosphatase A-like protein n=1 Tax=Jonquetella anthropi DSM 22815 TaxID=885272 RepID=H0UJ15_9BACT|nr:MULTISPECIES: phosphatidylglycerophosphatase A [Jonquetella]EHM13842.1 phosphatidylglycerophosphatase A-like protein [Jonquetella anthropi DSM 22815]ERL23759.1 phosphatidylglycerophosphatase A [Jonquetella sp. BV3C21]